MYSGLGKANLSPTFDMNIEAVACKISGTKRKLAWRRKMRLPVFQAMLASP